MSWTGTSMSAHSTRPYPQSPATRCLTSCSRPVQGPVAGQKVSIKDHILGSGPNQTHFKSSFLNNPHLTEAGVEAESNGKGACRAAAPTNLALTLSSSHSMFNIHLVLQVVLMSIPGVGSGPGMECVCRMASSWPIPAGRAAGSAASYQQQIW